MCKKRSDYVSFDTRTLYCSCSCVNFCSRPLTQFRYCILVPRSFPHTLVNYHSSSVKKSFIPGDSFDVSVLVVPNKKNFVRGSS